MIGTIGGALRSRAATESFRAVTRARQRRFSLGWPLHPRHVKLSQFREAARPRHISYRSQSYRRRGVSSVELEMPVKLGVEALQNGDCSACVSHRTSKGPGVPRRGSDMRVLVYTTSLPLRPECSEGFTARVRSNRSPPSHNLHRRSNIGGVFCC